MSDIKIFFKQSYRLVGGMKHSTLRHMESANNRDTKPELKRDRGNHSAKDDESQFWLFALHLCDGFDFPAKVACLILFHRAKS